MYDSEYVKIKQDTRFMHVTQKYEQPNKNEFAIR